MYSIINENVTSTWQCLQMAIYVYIMYFLIVKEKSAQPNRKGYF